MGDSPPFASSPFLTVLVLFPASLPGSGRAANGPDGLAI